MNIDLTNRILAAKEGKTLNKPFRTPKGPKKFSVYVKNEKGNVVKVNFGDPNMEIKRDDPDRRKSFRARHNCDNPGPKTKARYWSCRQWRAGKTVEGSQIDNEWDGQSLADHDQLLTLNPELAFVEEEITEGEEDCGCGGCGCGQSEAAVNLKEYSFNNPGQAMKKAREMGFEKIHTHGEGDDTVFMPGPSHEALLKKLGKSDASLWENIRKKKERIKKGSGEKMRKKGEKGAPTSEQIKKAQASDEEINMIAAQVAKSIDQLGELQDMMRSMPEDTDFEGWVQSKFTKIADYVNSVHSYLKYYESSDAPEEREDAQASLYDMSMQEYNEVMSLEDIMIAARPGPKSGAQTPAKPSERKKGSSKNKPGSAGKKGGSINFSESIINSLKEKVKKHNAKYSKKVTLGQLKKVYRRGAGAFSSSHRPGMSRGGWAMARVNMFLKMKRGGKVKDSYRRADGDI